MARGKSEGSIFQRKSDGLWVGRIELPAKDGKRRQKTVSNKDKNVVIAEMDKLKVRLHNSGDLPTNSMTIEQWCDYWIREVGIKTRRPKTMNSYKSVINNWIIPTVGPLKLDKLTPEHIRRVLSTMSKAGKSSTYARNAHSVMTAVFGDAWREERIHRNPVELVKPPVKAAPKLEVLTFEETRKLLELFAQSPDGYLWITYLLTGARRSEIVGLEWDRVLEFKDGADTFRYFDLSWQLQRIGYAHGCGTGDKHCGFKQAQYCPKRVTEEVPADYEYRHITGGSYWTRPKSRAGYREIPLVHPLDGILEQWRSIAPKNDYGLVFTRQVDTSDPRSAVRWAHLEGEQIPLDPDYITREWPKVLKAAGIKRNVRLHDLRHTAVDLLYAAGVDEDIIKDIVGHSTVTMSRSYRSRANRARLAAGLRQLSKSLGYEAPSIDPDPGEIAA